MLSSLRGREPTPLDRLYDAVAVAALPAPYLVRGLVALVVVLGLAGMATVASADSLPSEPLYPVKLASEQVRLALALSAEDRASVQLSMAEHRLTEAERLALTGMQAQAIVASSTYAADLAAAAAELATVEGDPQSRGAVVELKERLAEQQHHAAQVARELGSEPRGVLIAPVFRTVASFAPPRAAGVTVAEAIAEHGADVAGRIATVAEGIARASEEGSSGPEAQPSAATAPSSAAAPSAVTPTIAGLDLRPSPAGTPPAEATPSDDSRSAASSRGPRASDGAASVRPPAARPAIDPEQAREAAEHAKHEAEKAREAADKAKEAAKAPRAGSHSDDNDKGGAAGRHDQQGGGRGKTGP